MKIVPADPTIEALKRKAEECERLAEREIGTAGDKLREMAALCREWIASLRSGKWRS